LADKQLPGWTNPSVRKLATDSFGSSRTGHEPTLTGNQLGCLQADIDIDDRQLPLPCAHSRRPHSLIERFGQFNQRRASKRQFQRVIRCRINDIFVIHDTTPFALCQSEPVRKLWQLQRVRSYHIDSC
jgi:hypothetical protein